MQNPALTATTPPMLCQVGRAPEHEEAGALQYFDLAGLPMASVVLSMLDQSDDCIKVIGTDGSLQFMNCNGKKAMQIDDFADFAGQPWHSLWPTESQGAVQQSLGEARDGRASRFEAFCPTAKGDPRWWEVTVSPIRGGDGAVAGILSTSRDISDRFRREQQLETIAAEMRHRLRNAHAIGAALVMGATREAPEHRQFGLEIATRLNHLAEVQAHLLDVDGSMTLKDLCARTLAAFNTSNGAVQCGGDHVRLGEQGARVLALVIGELATNSVKYGSLGRGGEVEAHASVAGDAVELHWTERFDVKDEAPLTAPSSGQGVSLMKRMIALMDGGIEGGRTDTGYRAVVSLPLKRLEQ
ncbi:PAS domain-containing protein [Sphingomonas sabuli]|uniref:histidine kinase n=1 Tax=Sphingomonas sabuli TaxID=2764186 RepID=A0A7G9L0S2_9SPHN|nr:PAS domain-containing protein [Sphingomonas sabuli]QNM82221.1 PAS domain-containing protein [Sphingomonas sabuli]